MLKQFTYQINKVIPNNSQWSKPNDSSEFWTNSLLLLQNSLILNYSALVNYLIITHWKKSDVEKVEPSLKSLFSCFVRDSFK
jgi:hypothetical protein